MTIAYLDCFSGIAGDMTLGALIDCGVPLDKLRDGLAALPVEGWTIDAQPVLKNGIHALQVEIARHGETDDDELQRQLSQRQLSQQQLSQQQLSQQQLSQQQLSQQQSAESSHQETPHSHAHQHHHEHTHEPHSHDGEHSHSHSHVGEQSHAHSHEHEHSHIHGRSMAEIREVIESSTLSPRVKELSLKIFGEIARAEAKIHHSTPEDVHFHEIGGIDSLIDICGVAWCLDYLNVDEVYCSALPHSTGHVHCAHGIMPVPAPATLEMLRGAPFFPTALQGETITPTGAGIIAALNKGFGSPPAFVPHLIGCGAGKKNWEDRPNLLRITIGDKTETNRSSATSSTRNGETPSELNGLEWRVLSLLETNIDDMNPELWDHVLARLFEAGALDAWLQNVQMKKNRPATTLAVLCESSQRDAILSLILRETTTLGVRISEVQRAALPRISQMVQTPWGEVRVKVARWKEGNVERAAPEYDDVTRLARENGVAAHEVYRAALNAQRIDD